MGGVMVAQEVASVDDAHSEMVDGSKCRLRVVVAREGLLEERAAV
jgi:hypothetical protein